MPDPEEKDRFCPHCGATNFYILDLVGYRQPYDSKKLDYGAGEVQWDVDYPQYVKCAGSKRQITEYAVEQGIIAAAYRAVERNPKFDVEDQEGDA